MTNGSRWRRMVLMAMAGLPGVGAASATDLTWSPPALAAAQALAGDLYVRGQSYVLLQQLADELSPRLAGSAEYDAAAQWAVERFRAMGLLDVRLEPIVLAHGWQRGHAAATLLGAKPRPLHVAAYGWSPPTPPGGLRARVAVLNDTTDAAIAQAGLRGAIVLIDRQAFTGPVAFQFTSAEDWARQRRYETLGARLQAAGAAALLVYTKTVNQVLRTSDPASGGAALALPTGSLGREDALLLRRQLGKGPVDMELALDTQLQGPVTLNNVVAELRGASKPQEIVMLGAHLDSWDFATGAQDNGSGVAQVMDVARAMAALPVAPPRTLRFALWASEEEGLNGSVGYVRAHRAELPHVVVYLNSDTGAGRPLGWNVSGRRDLAQALAPLAATLNLLGGSAVSSDLTFDTDSGPFMVAGVPALNLDVVDDDYDAIVHHKPADTFDKVDAHDLAAGAAMMAVTAMAFASAAERPVPQLAGAQVRAILKDNGALDYVAASNMNALWQD